MVNDTTTLNGALSELGETMADNLFSMGVIDADATDGLTTLANKILNIEPSISGLDLDTSLVLHSSDDTCLIGQSIMFWAELKADYDDETATDVDLSGVLTGATVEFKNGNTVLGTAVTDSDGIAYYTHTFATVGVYDISASFNGTENFDDCVSNSISVSVTYEIVITADKPILSYNDHEYATISATLSDGAGGVSGETLSYEILDKEDNVLDSGSDVTDALGEISFTYQSAGVGDVQVIVYYGMFLQETYEIIDDLLYRPTEKTISTVGGSGNKIAVYDNNLSLNLPSDFELTFKLKVNTGVAGRFGLVPVANKGNSDPNYSILGQQGDNFCVGVYRTTSVNGVGSNRSITSSDYHTWKIIRNGDTFQWYCDDVQFNSDVTLTWFGNYSPHTLAFQYWGNASTVLVKDIVIKAL